MPRFTMKGMLNLSTLTMWALGLVATGALAAGSEMNAHIGKLDDANTQMVQRVSIVETQNQQYRNDIADLKKEIEALLWANGINPAKITGGPISTK